MRGVQDVPRWNANYPQNGSSPFKPPYKWTIIRTTRYLHVIRTFNVVMEI